MLCYIFYLCFIFSLSICSAEISSINGKLVFAHVVYRHGDRTPVETYPTDPYNNVNEWPTDWGQLTVTGMRQQYLLGKWLRARYDSIIGTKYSKNDIYVRSTDVDRTLMSALSNLDGMFPPKGDQIWNKNANWQPIPVHTIPQKDDYILAAKKKCPAYNYALKQLKKSDEYKNLDKRFAGLYKFLTKYTGAKINSIEGVQQIYNCLFIEELYNKTLPYWTNEVYPGDMKWIAARSFQTQTYTREMARLKSGPLLKEMLNRFKDKALGNLKPDRSLWVYSAHDTTVANLLNTLNLFELHSPPYTACVLLEMRLLNDTHFISIYYKNTTAEPLPLNIPGCGILCPLDNLTVMYEDVIPTDWESECEMSMLMMTYEEVGLTTSMQILLCIALIGLMIILILAGITFYRRRSYFDYRWYVQVEN